MGTIKTRKNRDGRVISYQATVRLKELRQPMYASFERITEARKWIQQQEIQVREGRHLKVIEAKRHTLAELIERYKVDSFPGRKSKGTPEQTLSYWQEHFGHLTLDQITPALLKERFDCLARAPSQRTGRLLSNRTLNCYLETLSAALSAAVREYEWIDDNPCLKIRKKPLRNQRERFLSTAELKRFLDAVERSSNTYLKPAVLLSLATGGRYSEVMGLTWHDVDRANRAVVFRDTKNGTTRSVPVGSTAWNALMVHGELRRLDTDHVFPNRKAQWKDGAAKHPKPYEELTGPFHRALASANISKFRWHDLRHQAASLLIATGATLADVGKLLGHKTSQMTWRYAHLTHDRSRDLVDRVDVLLRA